MNRHDYDKAVEWAVGELRGAVPQFGMSTAEVVAHFHWDNQDEDNMLVGLGDMTDTCVISHDVCLLIVGARLQAGMPLPRACIEWAGKMLHKARVGLNRPPILRVLRHAATLARPSLLPNPLILSRPFDL